MRRLRNWMHRQRQYFDIETTPEEVQLDAGWAVIIGLGVVAMLLLMIA